MRHVLAGDIGGTKTALALYRCEPSSDRVIEHCCERFSSHEQVSLWPIVQRFLREAGFEREELSAAAFGVAGPIVGRTCQTTNLPWLVDADELALRLDCPVTLMNDFRAVALGIPRLPSSALAILQDGVLDDGGPIAVIGAGTGLGEALLMRTGAEPVVIETEGGHSDLAPRNELEIELLRFVWERFGRASVERVVSGMGLCLLYDFLVAKKHVTEQAEVRAQMAVRDRGEVIGEHALAGTDEACARAVDWFLSLYGAEAGNFALKSLPTGGLFIAGGIAPKLFSKLQSGAFMRAFADKGRMSPLLTRLGVKVVLEPRVGLIGAAYAARALSRAQPELGIFASHSHVTQ
jgi:glucokinase